MSKTVHALLLHMPLWHAQRQFVVCIYNICPASFHETCQRLKFPLNGLRAQSGVSPVVGLLPLASGPACLGTDYKTNTQITKELKITTILNKLLEYKRNWIQYVNRMLRNRLPRVMKRYSPTGRRNHGRPLKRLLDT